MVGNRGRGGRGRGGRGGSQGQPYQGHQQFQGQNQQQQGFQNQGQQFQGNQNYQGQQNYGQQNQQVQQQQGQTYHVQVSGFPQGTQKNPLLAFLNQNAKFRFIKLRIQVKQQQGGPQTQGQGQQNVQRTRLTFDTNMLRDLLNSRVSQDSNGHILNFSKIFGASLGNQIKIDFNDGNFVYSLFGAIKGRLGATTHTLDVSTNNITTLGAFQNLTKTFPNLKKINFADNRIQSFGELDALRCQQGGFIELCFLGNPICQLDGYSEEVLARATELQYLDGKEVHKIKFTVEKKKITLGVPRPSFYDDSKTKEMVEKFFSVFLKVLDGDRNQLIEFYSSNPVLSLTVSAFEGQCERKESHDALRSDEQISRNLLKITDSKVRSELLIREKIPAVSFYIQKFPKCVHDFSDICVDSYMIDISGGGKVIKATVHGGFKDIKTGFLRSFDRVCILGPGNDKVPLLILNEHVHVRPYQPTYLAQVNKNKDVQQVQQGNQQQRSSPQNNPSPFDKLNQTQKLAFTQLKNDTRMTDEWTFNCLTSVNWDYTKAVQLFKEKKNTLPKDAFQ